VGVFTSVPSTFVVGRAGVGIGLTYGNRVLVDVAVMEVMHVTVMEIIRMSLVTHGDMSAIRTMFMTVLGMLCALTWFHVSPFDQLNTDFNQSNTEYDHARAGGAARIRIFSTFTELISRGGIQGTGMRTRPLNAQK
jgi:hypothetical protein